MCVAVAVAVIVNATVDMLSVDVVIVDLLSVDVVIVGVLNVDVVSDGVLLM